MSDGYPTSIKLPSELQARIDELAAAETRKRNPMIVILLREALEARGARSARKRRMA